MCGVVSSVSEAVLPSLVQAASRLTRLHLVFHTASPALFLRYLPHLTDLSIKCPNTHFSSKFISHIVSVTTLRSLSFHWDRRFSEKHMKQLIALKQLTKLEFKCEVSLNAYPLLTSLCSLRCLVLNSYTHSIFFSQLKCLTQLESLYLHISPRVDEEEVDAFHGFNNLTSLSIKHTLDIRYLRLLSSLTSLQSLELTEFYPSGLSFLNNLTTLTRLYIPNTHFALKRKLPLPKLRSLTFSITHQYPLGWMTALEHLQELSIFLHGKVYIYSLSLPIPLCVCVRERENESE
jgi:hypothetical protein